MSCQLSENCNNPCACTSTNQVAVAETTYQTCRLKFNKQYKSVLVINFAIRDVNGNLFNFSDLNWELIGEARAYSPSNVVLREYNNVDLPPSFFPITNDDTYNARAVVTLSEEDEEQLESFIADFCFTNLFFPNNSYKVTTYIDIVQK